MYPVGIDRDIRELKNELPSSETREAQNFRHETLKSSIASASKFVGFLLIFLA